MEVKQVCVYGAGLIGSGWVTHFLARDFTALAVYDPSEAALAAARSRVDEGLGFLVSQGVLTESEKSRRMAAVVYTTDRALALAGADLVQENGPEYLDVKQAMLAHIEAACRPDTIVASSTSSLPVDRIAEKARHPQRVLGAHPYHPVYLLPLVEVIRGSRLSDQVLADALAFYRGVDKKPVVLNKECPGYIGSHLMLALFRECVHLAADGVASLSDIDDAWTYGPGLRYALLGVHMVYQLAGGDGGIDGFLKGGIMANVRSGFESLADWKEWPPEARAYLDSCQSGVDQILAANDHRHGHTNEEVTRFRDEGLVKLLGHHGLL